MSDSIKHECGVALIRLRKPLQYYIDKYKTATYALNKMYLLMEKQHNRGQDGAGLASIKLDTAAGEKYVNRIRTVKSRPIQYIFKRLFAEINEKTAQKKSRLQHASWLKKNISDIAELYLGHLRYGTHGGNSIKSCHPVIRKNNWRSRNLVVAGNFNLTNVDEIVDFLIDIGQHPIERRDTVTVLEKIGHYLDREVQILFDKYKSKDLSNRDISAYIEKDLKVIDVLRYAANDFDGGYVMAGAIGHGDAFVMRDPHGIRPAYYYADDDIVVAASERPCIQTTFEIPSEKVKEIPPAHALIVKKQGEVEIKKFTEPKERRSCSFERIYFSRGTDIDIYKERKKLGYLLTEKVLKAVHYDFENTVFSFIPNTAEVAFYGLLGGVEEYLNSYKVEQIHHHKNNAAEINRILSLRPRVEKIAVKDVKMRTFITEDTARDDMVSHVYDVTYGFVNKKVDTLVLIDDSIVRGTTLQKSILNILDRLEPKKIIIVSSAPQIRYPDCYGIDMSKMHDFIAFRALIALVKEHKKEQELQAVYNQCKEAIKEGRDKEKNYVQAVYDQFSTAEISEKISEIVRPNHISSEVQVIFQTIEGLHQACPNHTGDWYFTGEYPTPGGYKVVNRAFVNYMEGKNVRAY